MDTTKPMKTEIRQNKIDYNPANSDFNVRSSTIICRQRAITIVDRRGMVVTKFCKIGHIGLSQILFENFVHIVN